MSKVALVTGASRGIGRAIALELARQGRSLALVYSSDKSGAEQTCQEIASIGGKAIAYACDVADFNQAAELIAKVNQDLGPVYILVNNAGITKDKLVLQMTEEDFQRVVDVNLKGAFNLIRHTYQGFMKQKEGRIINMSSVVGCMGNPGQANYAAAKAGLIGLTKSIAKELAGRNITCNAITPGMIDTDMVTAMSEKARATILSAIPLKRMGKPDDIAHLVAFLASDMAAYITGAVIPVDGGLNM